MAIERKWPSTEARTIRALQGLERRGGRICHDCSTPELCACCTFPSMVDHNRPGNDSSLGFSEKHERSVC